MDYIIYGYQIIPGSDDIISFAATQTECEQAALKRRASLRANDPSPVEITGSAVYRFVVRSMNTAELLLVMNGEASVTDVASVSRRLVALVAD